jgi:hypothetical protein
VYKTICNILQKEDVDNNDEVMYHAASIQLMEAYLWKGILAQHVLYLLGGCPSSLPGFVPTQRYALEPMPTTRSRASTTGVPE